MVVPFCKECRAIHQEILKLIELSHRSKPDPNATPQQLAAWIDRRAAEANRKPSLPSALSKLRRRLIEHQKLTGHALPFSFPPAGLVSRN